MAFIAAGNLIIIKTALWKENKQDIQFISQSGDRHSDSVLSTTY